MYYNKVIQGLLNQTIGQSLHKGKNVKLLGYVV